MQLRLEYRSSNAITEECKEANRPRADDPHLGKPRGHCHGLFGSPDFNRPNYLFVRRFVAFAGAAPTLSIRKSSRFFPVSFIAATNQRGVAPRPARCVNSGQTNLTRSTAV